MAQKKPVVEIIPWIHSAEFQAHADVVEYIKKLPKNSHLALEVDPGMLAIIGKAEDLLIGRSPNLRGLGRAVRGIRRHNISELVLLALHEVLHECRKRNITITPLETTASFAATLRYIDAPEWGALEHVREETHARQIQAKLMKFSGEKLPVIIGGSHAFELKTRLEKLGIAATVNMRLFTDRHMERYMRLFTSRHMEKYLQPPAELEKAVKANKYSRAKRIAIILRKFKAEKSIRTESPLIIAMRIDEELRAKAARPERKLAERKQKLAARLARQQRRK